MQVNNIISYCKNKTENRLTIKHTKQQFVELLWIRGLPSIPIKFAKWERNINGTFIPLNIVKTNEYLKKIWDITLNFQYWHVEDLRHILSGEELDYWMHNQPIQKVIPDEVLKKLCEELDQTNQRAEFFDKELFSKTDSEEENPF